MSRLLDLRLEHGFETQKQLADAAGITNELTSRIERGEVKTPQGATLAKLAPLLGGMTPSQLRAALTEETA
jgi:transcriptional regulator with XRE-family HTH domain